MRKTRLVILPTKCLHQMGFLLLFLSCPVIGDWGRIRPESENSHNAIQIQREGTCGLERDPPGGLLGFLNENGSKQCRLSEDSDMTAPTKTPSVEASRRSLERRVDVRRVDQERKTRVSERRVDNIRRMRSPEERRDVRRESERRVRRDVRSRSVETRRSSTNRSDIRARSLSLSRLENERSVRNQRSVPRNTRQFESSRRERLHPTRENDRRVEQRRLNRDLPNERQERDTARLRTTERRDVRRENNRRSTPEQSMRRDNDMRRQSRERIQNVRERTENRLSLGRREADERRTERTETRRISERANLERRVPELRKARSLERFSYKSNRQEDSNNRREIDTRRFVTVAPKISERNLLERRNERVEGIKSRRVATIRVDAKPELNTNEESQTEGIGKWMDLTSYDNFKTGDWTTNCVIGAVVYFLTTRQVKAV